MVCFASLRNILFGSQSVLWHGHRMLQSLTSLVICSLTLLGTQSLWLKLVALSFLPIRRFQTFHPITNSSLNWMEIAPCHASPFTVFLLRLDFVFSHPSLKLATHLSKGGSGPHSKFKPFKWSCLDFWLYLNLAVLSLLKPPMLRPSKSQLMVNSLIPVSWSKKRRSMTPSLSRCVLCLVVPNMSLLLSSRRH